jgi:GMP synthase (glutamine-hydrolysing)
MRLNESSQVAESLRTFGLKLIMVDATADFVSATTFFNGKQTTRLDQTIDPEEKRNICGDTFMRVTDRELRKLNLPVEKTFLVQGTLRPDLIESASQTITSYADVIKTHHNDTLIVRQLRSEGKIIEPLADYHKDEVRILGEQLGLPAEIVWRHPFPGPGLAIRILCADKPYITEDFREINEKLKKFSTSQYKITLLPVRSVGVQGDGRTYSYAAAITGKADWPVLMELAKKLPKTIHQLNRVVYLFGKDLPEEVVTITPTTLQPEVIEQLRQADAIVTHQLLESKEITQVSQVPVISIPIPFDKQGNRSIVIRTIITNDFMTGIPATPGEQLSVKTINKMVSEIMDKVPGISRVAYDLTGKPPGTTEWE